MAKLRRWLKRITISLLLLIVVAVTAVLIWIDTDWGHRWLRDQAVDEMRAKFPGGVRIGRLEGSVYDEVVLRDVEIAAIDHRPAIKIATVRVHLAFTPALRKRVVIEKVVAEDVEIVLGEAPLTPPPTTTTEPGSPLDWAIELPDVAVHRARLVVEGKQPITLDGIEATAELAKLPGRPFGGSVRVAGAWAERALPFQAAVQLVLEDYASLPFAQVAIGDPGHEIRITAHDVVVDPLRPTGSALVEAPREAIARLSPSLVLPADPRVFIVATKTKAGSHVDLHGALGATEIRGVIQGDLASEQASVYLTATGVDAAKLSNDKLHALGDVGLALRVDPTRIAGIITVRGLVADLPLGHATVFVDTTWRDDKNPAVVTALATTAGDVRVAATTRLVWQRGALLANGTKSPVVDVDAARVVAIGKDLAKASADRVLVVARDDVTADVALKQPGRAWPEPDLVLAGTARGTRIVYDGDTLVGGATARFDVTAHKKQLAASGHADLRGVVQDGTLLGAAGVDAWLLDDQKRIGMRLEARPAKADVDIYANATITPGDTIEIAVGNHRIVPKVGATWIGSGGRISITDTTTKVRGITTSTGTGKVTVQADVVKPTRSLAVQVEATGVPASVIDPAYRGTASGTVTLKRRGLRWDGDGSFALTGIATEPDAPPIDGTVKLAIAGRSVTADVTASSAGIGSGRFGLEVEGPTDITDVDAWQALDRSAIHKATVQVDKLDLAALSPTGGTIEGDLQLAGADTKGTLEIRGIETPLGVAEGQVVITPLGDNPFASWTANIADVGTANVGVQIALPKRPFDPVAWKQHGRRLVPSLSVSVDDIAVDPAKLAKLGIQAPYRGRLDLKLAASGSAGIAKLDIDARSVQGGVLAQPLDAQVHVETGPTGTSSYACVDRAAKPGQRLACQPEEGAPPPTKKLVELREVTLPIAFDTWITAPKTALAAPLAGTLAIPSQEAAPVIAIFGRKDFVGGTLDGTIAIAGTPRKPTANGQISLVDTRVVSWIPGRTVPMLKQVLLQIGWNGVAIDNQLTIKEASGGSLVAYVKGRPDRLDELVTGYTAISLDIAPIAAFLPGDISAATGKLGGSGLITGVDPAKLKIKGNLYLTEATVPVTPILGTLRDGYARIEAYADKDIELVAHGILGTCRNPRQAAANKKCTENVHLTAKTPHDLSTLEANLQVTQVAPIGEIEPLIDGKARAMLRRDGRRWSGDIWVTDASVYVPPSQGEDLLDEMLPDDVWDASKPIPVRKRVRAPTKTWLTADVHVASTPITVEEWGVQASVRSKRLKLLVGDAIGLDGKLAVEYGTANDVFGRQYRIEPTDIVTFEGTIDPEVDLEMTHQFPALTLEVKVRGKVSDPDFPQLVFEDDQGRYGQGELLAFFLGGDPSGDASAQARDAGIGVGSSLVMQQLTRRFKKVLPRALRFDVFRCEQGAAAAGTACTFGKTVANGRGQIAYRVRSAPSPNENPGEGVLQYYFTPDWYGELVGGTANVVGADLLWRHRW
ncbi:MAG TPA: translocation/assembly module TamB domain-containing protein [Kofleriaceae bacterium]|nr:translocation/assembly module TamB domain-containing protein [Kofleriaceae bacterium]